MTTNIVKVSFGTSRTSRTRALYQYDKGQILQIVGIDLPTAYEVDFTADDVTSVTQIGGADGVTIPDSSLDKSGELIAYIRLHSGEDDTETVYKTIIPVIGRAQITDEQPTPHEQSVIEQAISALNDAVEATAADVETTTANAQAAAQSEANAATSERSAAASAGAALASQNAAESASQSATESASGAAESARNAANSAAQAAESATNAQASAEQAEQSAQSISGDAERAEQAATTATGKATEAATSATTANGAAQTATGKASEASASATAAANSASAAAGSATNAAASATAAQTAQTAAETAQGKAEDAQAAAEQAKDDSAAAADRAEQAEQEVLSAMGGTYENLTSGNAQQLLSTVTEANSVPYLIQPTASNADRAYLDEVVGGTVAWNQLASLDKSDWGKSRTSFRSDGTNITITTTSDTSIKYIERPVVNGHKYLFTGVIVPPTLEDESLNYNMGFGYYIGITNKFRQFYPPNTRNIIANIYSVVDDKVSFRIVFNTITPNGVSGTVENPQLFDLTQLFGSTIADYIYNLETATAGAGVAYFRKLFPKPYYEYNAGELLYVGGVSAHTMRDADGNVISTYPLDSSLELRGIPKLDTSGNLYYDGDTYSPDGTVTRRFKNYTFTGSENWNKFAPTQGSVEWFQISLARLGLANASGSGAVVTPSVFDAGYELSTFNGSTSLNNRYGISSESIRVSPSNASSLTKEQFAQSLVGKSIVYELATATTETATPYRHLQICDPNGTEEFVSTGIVPVGHNTRYPENLRAKIEGLPWNFNSIIAMTETTTKASKAYSVGDYFILNNVLYRVISAIASGGTITIGTNCRATTIMDEIKALS